MHIALRGPLHHHQDLGAQAPSTFPGSRHSHGVSAPLEQTNTRTQTHTLRTAKKRAKTTKAVGLLRSRRAALDIFRCVEELKANRRSWCPVRAVIGVRSLPPSQQLKNRANSSPGARFLTPPTHAQPSYQHPHTPTPTLLLTKTHTHTHTHTHTCQEPRDKNKARKAVGENSSVSRAALDVFRSVEVGWSATECWRAKVQYHSLLPSPDPNNSWRSPGWFAYHYSLMPTHTHTHTHTHSLSLL